MSVGRFHAQPSTHAFSSRRSLLRLYPSSRVLQTTTQTRIEPEPRSPLSRSPVLRRVFWLLGPAPTWRRLWSARPAPCVLRTRGVGLSKRWARRPCHQLLANGYERTWFLLGQWRGCCRLSKLILMRIEILRGMDDRFGIGAARKP